MSDDYGICQAMLRRGSKSFSAAAALLPATVRRSVVPLYAFCREADDLIDQTDHPDRSLVELTSRLDAIYAGRPGDSPVDREFTRVVERHEIPFELPDALLDGFRWEVAGRRYNTLADVRAYSARVAAAVGAIVTVIMGRRDRASLARACDLGVAMQLTNIARDVGEDARRGRWYLPAEWAHAEGLDLEQWLRDPRPTPTVARLVAGLLCEAERLYHRAEPGIERLPAACRPAIWAARLVYADIGRVIRHRQFDSVTGRAVTTSTRKLRLLGRAALMALKEREPRAGRNTPPLAETAFLVDAVDPSAPTGPRVRASVSVHPFGTPGEMLHVPQI